MKDIVILVLPLLPLVFISRYFHRKPLSFLDANSRMRWNEVKAKHESHYWLFDCLGFLCLVIGLLLLRTSSAFSPGSQLVATTIGIFVFLIGDAFLILYNFDLHRALLTALPECRKGIRLAHIFDFVTNFFV